MTIFGELKQSNAWDRASSLPLIPMHSNPWIYTAYCYRVFADLIEPNEREAINSAVKVRLVECEPVIGYVSKYPGDTSPTSHDELLGAAYLSVDFAKRALVFLDQHDGTYTLGEPTLASNMYKFVFMVPALKALAGYRVGLFSQFLFSVLVLWDAFHTKPGEANDTLKIWLCYPAMRFYPVSGAALSIWETRWLKRGYNPKTIFKNNYLTEVPILTKYARGNFT